MEHKKAISVLINILDKRSISAEEKEAVLTAIGVLDWASRAKSRIKALKDRKIKSMEW
ncbi:MAG: hypothetical protein V1756_02265 [Patescibacteria group bacterium]